LDLLLALIPLTILLGMVAVNMGNILYLSENTIYQSSLQRVGSDTADALVETSGSPYNWEEIGVLYTPGLARFDKNKNLTAKNYLSAFKIYALNDTQLQNMLGPGYGFYMNLSSTNSTAVLNIKEWGTYNNSSPNIVRVEREVLASKLELVTSLEGLIRATGQPRVYYATFPTNNFYVNSYDYWVVVENRGYDSASVDVNEEPVITQNQIHKDVTEIKSIINKTILYNQTYFQDNTVKVRAESKPGSSMDVYVIAAFPGTPEEDITLENARLRTSKLILFVWTR
jgi:hypothetical protein